MDIGAILLIIALLVAVGLFLAAPLIGGAGRGVTPESQEASTLMAERDRVIAALRELDFDFQLGKVPTEDYPPQRTDLLEKGADILRKLDAIAPPARVPRSGERSRIEQAAAGKGNPAQANAEIADDKIESMLAARRAERGGKSAGFCPRCGKPILVTDQFCPNCGKGLK
jgi:hypothetical protein